MRRSAAVAGAGPAGLSASVGLARLGFEVHVFEERRIWTPRVCGAFLSPEAHGDLIWLGILPQVMDQSAPCAQVTLHALGRAESFSILRQGIPGRAISRKNLEELLRLKAESEGVQIHFGAKVIEQPPCDIFVAAGGRFSALRELDPKKKNTKEGWVAFNVELRGARQNPGELSLHFLPGAYVGSLTFADGTTNLSGLVHSRFRSRHPGSWEEILAWMKREDSDLRSLLQNCEMTSSFKGIPFLPFGPQSSKHAGEFTVGDNAAVCDPFMGEGIARALSAGPALFRSLKGVLSRPGWKEDGLKNYAVFWRRNYAFRMRLGYVFRKCLESPVGLFALFQGLTRVSFIRSWVLERIHHRPVWTEGH